LAKCHLLPPLDPEQRGRRGARSRPAGWGARRRLRPRRRPGTRGKERGGQGEPILMLTSSYCARWRRLRGRAEGGGGATGGDAAVVLGEEGRRRCEVAVVWCGEPGRPSAPFIGGERRFGAEIFLRRAPLRRARGASRGGDGSAGSTCAGVRPWMRPVVQARGRLRRPVVEWTARAGS
jgi:hypothetical protein